VEPYEAREILERADPLKALTLFHEIHPTIDLQNLRSLSSSFLARAAASSVRGVGRSLKQVQGEARLLADASLGRRAQRACRMTMEGLFLRFTGSRSCRLDRTKSRPNARI